MTENVIASDIPKTCLALETKARVHHWRTEIDRKSGVYKGKEIDSVVLKMVRGRQRVVALYENGAFLCGLQQSPFRRLNSREVAAIVTAEVAS